MTQINYPTGLLVPKDWRLGAPFFTPTMFGFALPESYEAPHTPPKQQGQCGSCSHFASIGAYESALMKKNGGQVVDLSEQSVLDCAKYDNYKCQGSFFHGRHLVENGAPLDKDDPYQGRASNSCRNLPTAFEKPAQYGYVGSNNGWPSEQMIREAIYKYGGLWVTVYAGNNAWQNPGEVIRQAPRGQSDHAVLVIGWKPDPQNPGKYLFKIKNSWGLTWAQGGYVWIVYGVSNFGETAAFVALAEAPAPQPDPAPTPDPVPPIPDPTPDPEPTPGPNPPGPIPDPLPPEPTPDPVPPTPDPDCKPANMSLPKRYRVTAGAETLIGVRPETGYTYAWYEVGLGGAAKQIATGATLYYKTSKDTTLKVVATSSCGITEVMTEIEIARSFARNLSA